MKQVCTIALFLDWSMKRITRIATPKVKILGKHDKAMREIWSIVWGLPLLSILKN